MVPEGTDQVRYQRKHPLREREADTIGCESDIFVYDAAKVAEIVATDQRLEELPPHTGIVAGPGGTGPEDVPQVEQVPVGGADTGVAVEPTGGDGTAAVAGGLVLAAAGGAFLSRRRARTA